MALASIIAATIYAAYLHRTVNYATDMEAVPGWEDLIRCSYVVSFDGTKALELRENRTASLREGENKTIEGHWSFDEISKRYAITLNGATTAYSIVSPTSSFVCILIVGDIGAADLRASWFFSPGDTDPDPDQDRERDIPGL